MKKIILYIFILTSISLFGSENIPNGFYYKSQVETPLCVTDQQNRKHYLGEKIDFKILKCDIRSSNNANSVFQILLTTPLITNTKPFECIFVNDNQTYCPMGPPMKKSSIEWVVYGRENAEKLAEYFHSEVLYREHPHHELEVSFTTDKRSYQVNDEVMVTMKIKNIGKNVIAFHKGGMNRAQRDQQYIFSCYYRGRQVADIGTNYHHGGLGFSKSLNPGEVFKDKVSLSKWFTFDKPGMYQVHGAYKLIFYKPDSLIKNHVIWTDFVSKNFAVRVNKPDTE